MTLSTSGRQPQSGPWKESASISRCVQPTAANCVQRCERLQWQAQETLSGFEGVKVISKIHQMGLRLKGLGDFFKLLPSKAEYDAAKVL